MASLPRRAALLLAPAAVLAIVFARVSPTNFAGHDEWLIDWMVRHGITSFPYAHRPLDLLWVLPAPHLGVGDWRGFWLLHGLYLAASGALTAWMARRWLRLPAFTAALAGVLAAVWAPSDLVRLNAVMGGRYTGDTVGALIASALFVAGWRRRAAARAGGIPLMLMAAVLAAAMAWGQESTTALLAGAPLVALAARPADGRRRRFLFYALAWEAVLAAATLPLLLSMRVHEGYQYQSAAGFDPHPLRWSGRLLRQLGRTLLPVVATPPRELWIPAAAGAVAVIAVVWLLLGRRAPPPTGVWGKRGRAEERRLLRAALLGIAMAVLGWLTFTLSPIVARGGRTQIVSAPGTGLLLAALVGLLATALRRPAVAPVAAAWLVAVAAGRTEAQQRQWDRDSFWAGQSGTLRQLAELAPAPRPGTLLLLIDGHDTWRASFSFRHAVHLLYGPEVVGQVWNGHPFLYPLRFAAGGVHVDPLPAIRGPWGVSPTAHGYGSVVVLRLDGNGRLLVAREWPAELPPLPTGLYRPDARLRGGPPAQPFRGTTTRGTVASGSVAQAMSSQARTVQPMAIRRPW